MICFGYFKGLPYGDICIEDFESYRNYKNDIPKEKIIAHIEDLDAGLTSVPDYDIFTGEKIHVGVYLDGDFSFPMDFLRYYKRYDIGIPYEYEEYLKQILK